MTTAFGTFLILAGTILMLLAAVGVLRMPDLFTRMQATSKATSLGVACIMLGVALYFGEVGVTIRAGAIILFFFFTAPVAAHVIARAAYFTGTDVWRGTVVDELRKQHVTTARQPTEPTR